jgi:hypothetical protein
VGVFFCSMNLLLFLLYGKNGGCKHKIRFRADIRRF